MVRFRCWGPDLRDFFTGLGENNSRAYFDANRDRYRVAVREPTEALVDALSPRYGPGRIFRLNRDVRFSADKSPYHTNLGVEFSGRGVHHYVSVSADELLLSVGAFRPDTEWIDRFRRAVAGREGDALAAIVDKLAAGDFQIGGEELQRTPRGYPPDHPHARLLRHKGLTASRSWPPPAWLGKPDVLDLIVATFDEAAPLSEWLSAHCPLVPASDR